MNKDLKQLDKEFEEVEAIGQDNEKEAIKAAKSILGEKEKQIAQNKEKELDYLHSNRPTIITYNKALAGLLIKYLRDNEWPKGWQFYVSPDDIGVIMEVHAPNGRMFRSAFKSTGEEKYDRQAVERYAERAQNTVDRLEQTNG